jgi:hypothetical protein
MAVLDGFLLDSAFAPDQNPNLTTDFDLYDLPLWPTTTAAVSELSFGTLVKNYPVSARGVEKDGWRVPTFFDDYYNRIHITPASIAYGNIVSTQQAVVELWNAFIVPRTLISITGEEVGLSVSGQPEPSFFFTGLQVREWTVTATIDGVFALDTDLQWVFDTQVAALTVTGSRIQVFPYLIDWGSSVRERLQWRTDVLTSASYFTQRRQLWQHPRRYFSAEVVVDKRDRQAFDLAIFGWGSRVWLLQLLATPLTAGADFIACDTENLDFYVGGLVLLRGETIRQFEACEVAEVQAEGLLLARDLVSSWPAQTRLYPARPARLNGDPRLRKRNDQVQQTEVEFMCTDVSIWPEIMPDDEYLGYPVFTRRPSDSNDLTSTFERILTTLDISGALPRVTDIAATAMPVIEHEQALVGRADIAEFKSFIYALSGRRAAVWVITNMDDMTIVSAASESIVIELIGVTRYALGQPGRRHICIELVDGSLLFREIEDMEEIDSETERLYLTTAFSPAITAADVARISWMFLAAQATDTVELEYVTDSEGLCLSSQRFIGVRDDEF